ncbi:hopanoid biosynthesis associated radical SAM protein HpnH [Planctomycetales bacterium]|nr:hopanoid biosynthesis associated radical SAM protein HpnH [Planctomycetales bacterium]
MRFPSSLLRSMTGYLLRKKISGPKKFPLVLMLEPLHTCNLHCSGCGRIREYAGTLGQQVSVDDSIQAVKDCGAPIVSICGGEPLIYPDIIELTEKILNLGKHIYLCTNGQLLEKRIPDFVELSRKNKYVKKRLYWNVHLDGTADIHDAITGKSGSFDTALNGIVAAKKAGFFVYTNTTLYKNITAEQLVPLAEQLTAAGIDGMMTAPAFGYESVENSSIFLNKNEVHQLFRNIRKKLDRYKLTATPLYLDFLCGEREVPCAAWANPTFNVKGWKAPCYLLTDKHYRTYKEFIEETDWNLIGPGKDVRCENCLMHCGFEPAAVLFGNRLRDLLRLAFWQLG